MEETRLSFEISHARTPDRVAQLSEHCDIFQPGRFGLKLTPKQHCQNVQKVISQKMPIQLYLLVGSALTMISAIPKSYSTGRLVFFTLMYCPYISQRNT